MRPAHFTPAATAPMQPVPPRTKFDPDLRPRPLLPCLEPLHRTDGIPFPRPNSGHRLTIQQRRPPPLVSSQIQVNQESPLPCLPIPQLPEEPEFCSRSGSEIGGDDRGLRPVLPHHRGLWLHAAHMGGELPPEGVGLRLVHLLLGRPVLHDVPGRIDPKAIQAALEPQRGDPLAFSAAS